MRDEHTTHVEFVLGNRVPERHGVAEAVRMLTASRFRVDVADDLVVAEDHPARDATHLLLDQALRVKSSPREGALIVAEIVLGRGEMLGALRDITDVLHHWAERMHKHDGTDFLSGLALLTDQLAAATRTASSLTETMRSASTGPATPPATRHPITGAATTVSPAGAQAPPTPAATTRPTPQAGDTGPRRGR
ncbi:hypothetical protein [Streptomyces sp. SID3343]|uniref:hypothetical protein n=1 Tax=Streptomyces sp. SID3343 TaxID=2690260 RepID=UPI00136D41B3|nr:hypothetical protein [Streptomyces sp. SID3343]MYW06202.1 hypothetical protein [Streptomyces sp. SID3343]